MELGKVGRLGENNERCDVKRGWGRRVKFTAFGSRSSRKVLYCRNPRRDGRRRPRARLAIRPSFDARFRSSRRSASLRTFAVGENGDVPFWTGPGVAAIVATCRQFHVDRRSAFAALFRRFGPKYPFIPNGLRFDLSTAFRRGSVRFVAPTARPPTCRFSARASLGKMSKDV